MSVAIKTINKKRYLYLVRRQGKRVVTRYIGPADSPEAMKMASAHEKTSSVPEGLRGLFWDTNIGKISLKQNAEYVIVRVLEFGGLDAVSWLQRVYATQRILDVIGTSRILSRKSGRFWRLWFDPEGA